ncbi:hypothetical protein [Nitrosomonas communis]|uniref:DDE family transposase n=1 Tax=Nitrosomonas communis TaxID=44574 RepID=A0A1H2Q3V0_9PROT|nr:hypothetical protein [Nitrosomonas communis]SDW01334.1 hypothetical protein SAMN05421882_1001203 [Nitrosomonas communis]
MRLVSTTSWLLAYVQRLNQVADVFAPLLALIQQGQETRNSGQVWLIDSFPVALAKQGHRFNACVAKELADSGYCSTKKLYYHGVRVHIIGRRQPGSLPIPEYIGVTGASDHDGKIFDQIRPQLHHNELYGDKAYQRPDAEEVRQAQNLTVLTLVKNKKGNTIWNHRINGCLQRCLAFGNRLKPYLPGLKKKQALNVPAKFVLIRGLWCMSSESWLRLYFSGIFCELVLNSHLSSLSFD